jgi:hypothetical protein
MTTAPVVFVASLSVRCSSNHSAIKICSMLFVSQWERLYETCTRSKRRYPCLSQVGDAFLHASRVIAVIAR